MDNTIYQNTIESSILSNLIYRDEYREKVLPHIKAKYFPERPLQVVFNLISDHVQKYDKPPTKEMLFIELNNTHSIGSETDFRTAAEIIEQLKEDNNKDLTWLLDHTEKWCRDKAIYHAIYTSIEVLQDKSGTQSRTAIPALVQEAVAISFQQRHSVDIADLLENYIPPEYLIENLFKCGYVYSLTGLTSSGKTAIALCLAMHVATNANIGNRAVNGGRVVYFAGENPDDVTQRLMGMTDGIDATVINLSVVPYASRETAELAIGELIADGREIALLVIDTSTAYFAGEDENDNKAALEHAKWLRSISARLPGNPTVLVACHPTKNATDDNMLPRGGGAFLNEVDGNLACIKKGDLTVISQHGKYRDVYFSPIPFLRSVKYCERLKTKSGKLMPTVVAHLATEQEAAEHEFQVRTEDMQVLELLNKDTAMSLRDIASKLFWITKGNNIDATKAKRVIDRLRKAKLIGEDNQLTGLGEKKLNEYQQSSPKPAGSGGNGAEHNIVRGLFEERHRCEAKTDG
jgi:hypothetical protein